MRYIQVRRQNLQYGIQNETKSQNKQSTNTNNGPVPYLDPHHHIRRLYSPCGMIPARIESVRSFMRVFLIFESYSQPISVSSGTDSMYLSSIEAKYRYGVLRSRQGMDLGAVENANIFFFYFLLSRQARMRHFKSDLKSQTIGALAALLVRLGCTLVVSLLRGPFL